MTKKIANKIKIKILKIFMKKLQKGIDKKI